MINKKFLQQQMKRIETNYGKAKFNVTQEVFDLWYEMFSKYDPNGFKVAIDEYMRTNEFPPNIAGINKIYQKLDDEREHIAQVIRAKYKWVARWFEEQPSAETYKLFVNYICSFPVIEREKQAEELAYQLVAYWNECAEQGMPINKRATIKELLKERLHEC